MKTFHKAEAEANIQNDKLNKIFSEMKNKDFLSKLIWIWMLYLCIMAFMKQPILPPLCEMDLM